MRLIIRWPRFTWRSRLAHRPEWLDRLHCAVTGHDDEIVVGRRLIALRCRCCRRRSPGWRLDGPDHLPPNRRTSGPIDWLIPAHVRETR